MLKHKETQSGAASPADSSPARADRRGRGSLERGLGVLLLAVVVSLAFGTAAFAHHGGAAWDMKTTLTLKGTVTEFRFINPHAQIYFTATDDKGNKVNWSCETADPAMLERQGWSRETLKPGDQVTVIGHPAKTGVKVMVLDKLVLANGQEISAKAIAN